MSSIWLHFDPSSGISGDMTLGALLDLGLDIRYLTEELSKLGVEGFHLEAERIQSGGFDAMRCLVKTAESDRHRHLSHIERMIQDSRLDDQVKRHAIAAFRQLARAEAKVHGQTIETIHFHEVGALDAIVDVVGAMIGFRFLDVQGASSGPLNVGGGEVNCQHGILPIPAPATAELLKGIPTFGDSGAGELTTPTGAAIIRTLCSQFGGQPLMRAKAIGYGAGTRTSERRPNVLRLFLGNRIQPGQGLFEEEKIAVIEATIDDASPQVMGHFYQKALDAGVKDVFTSPVHMKKNRPGVLLQVLCHPDKLDETLQLVFRETTTLGVRFRLESRAALKRREVAVNIPEGTIRLKVAFLGGQVVNFMPEFEDCCKASEASGIPLKQIQTKVIHEFMINQEDLLGDQPDGLPDEGRAH